MRSWMAEPEARPCPFCGSADTQAFADGSGVCRSCGRASRGGAPVGALLQGEATRKAAVVREKVGAGRLGVVGALLGFAGVPGIFLLGAALRGRSVGEWTATVFNSPTGALSCGGASLLVIFSVYAMWAGLFVGRGYPEKGTHLLVAGVLMAVASALGGLGLAGSVGIAAGALVVLGGVLAWRIARAQAE